MEAISRILTGATKRKVFRALARGPRTLRELAAEVGGYESTAYAAIRELRAAGLVAEVGRVPGRRARIFGVDPAGLRAVASDSLGLVAQAGQESPIDEHR